MSHTPPIFIQQGKNTVAYFTTQQPKHLIVFVHGFNGSAINTWNDFPSLIRNETQFADADVAFFGYDSLKGQTNNNAIKFYRFLEEIAQCNAGLFGYNRTHAADHKYDKIIIVAHSLGAIVARRALLNANAENKTWLDSVKMVLFAPAHRGARVQNLIAESLPVLGRVLAGLGFISMPVLDDLRPDSQTIQNLISETNTLLHKNEGRFLIAHAVVWANKEIIVHNERFCQDPIAIVIDDHHHTSVCKPISPDFMQPFEIITQALL